MIVRILLGLGGALAGGWGLWLLISTVPLSKLLLVAGWLVAAVVLHDAVWSPTLLGIGAGLGRVPPRARRFMQAGLIVAGCLVVVAVPMIMARGRQPASTTVLVQDVGANLLVLLGLVAAVTLLAWRVRVLRDRRGDGGRGADA